MIHEDGTITLRPDQTKLVLALALDRHDSTWTSTQLDNLIAELALALFGPDGKHVTAEDVTQLRHEAYAEYRRG